MSDYGKDALKTKLFIVNKQENQNKCYIVKGTSWSGEWASEEEGMETEPLGAYEESQRA